jgi:hypothetical protein
VRFSVRDSVYPLTRRRQCGCCSRLPSLFR